MQWPNRILVPVDFSESSHAALEFAGLIGAQLGAKIDVLHVWSPPEEVESKLELLADFAMSDEGHTMVAWLTSFRQHSDIEAHGRLALGASRDVPDVIVQAVQVGEYDLIIMGTHEHQGLLHMLTSSIAEKVVRRAPCPVITVPAEGAPSRGRTSAKEGATTAWAKPS
jgi:nucleotide-binding universal stress UspA family protein